MRGSRKWLVPPLDSCTLCGEPAGLIIQQRERQFCGIECLERWRSGVKTKPICPVCKGESLHKDVAWWVCGHCNWKGAYPTRVEVKEDGDGKGQNRI